MVDEIDRKILDLLQGNAKLSNAEIAESVGLTVSSVHERVKKLERKGVIKGYVAVVDAEKMGKPLLAFSRLTVSNHDGLRTAVQKLCEQEPDILECHNVAGEDCYILKIRASGPKELERLLLAIKDNADSGRSVTNIVLSSFKESTKVAPAPLEQGEQI
ncbi:MAG TPA: Lrp/AsnC family transcriptional regulator [Spirochaetia bacterium]|nr:Lrp/AsnC family transcriptional regulator [Spirochaetia bacterium]